jgi:hypothetical protein
MLRGLLSRTFSPQRISTCTFHKLSGTHFFQRELLSGSWKDTCRTNHPANNDNYLEWGCTLEQAQSSHGNQTAPLKWWQRSHLLWNPSGNPQTEIMVNQNTPVPGTAYATFVPCPKLFCLLKLQFLSVPRRRLKMSWVLALPLPMACPELCNKPFSAFTMSLFDVQRQVVRAGIWNPRSLGLRSKTMVSFVVLLLQVCVRY